MPQLDLNIWFFNIDLFLTFLIVFLVIIYNLLINLFEVQFIKFYISKIINLIKINVNSLDIIKSFTFYKIKNILNLNKIKNINILILNNFVTYKNLILTNIWLNINEVSYIFLDLFNIYNYSILNYMYLYNILNPLNQIKNNNETEKIFILFFDQEKVVVDREDILILSKIRRL